LWFERLADSLQVLAKRVSNQISNLVGLMLLLTRRQPSQRGLR